MGFAPAAAAITPATAAGTLARINASRREMKTFLLLAVSSVITAGVLPSLPAKIILSAFVLLAAVSEAARRPAGYGWVPRRIRVISPPPPPRGIRSAWPGQKIL